MKERGRESMCANFIVRTNLYIFIYVCVCLRACLNGECCSVWFCFVFFLAVFGGFCCEFLRWVVESCCGSSSVVHVLPNTLAGAQQTFVRRLSLLEKDVRTDTLRNAKNIFLIKIKQNKHKEKKNKKHNKTNSKKI